MWERLSFYGMRALLILFLVDQVAHGGLGLDDRTAAAIYGTVRRRDLYLLPARRLDRRSGARQPARGADRRHRDCAGPSAAAASRRRRNVFFLGLLVIVIGTGLLKPNAAALVAQLYPEGGARRDAGFHDLLRRRQCGRDHRAR